MHTSPLLAQHLSELASCLSQTGKTVTCAESCTGGLIGATLTSVAGSSGWFNAGFITYSNEMKTKLLGVPQDTLDEFGAVSEPVVKAMANGALASANADYAVSVSGIAGPGGGTEFKPVGTVCFGFAIKGRATVVTTEHFSGERDQVRAAAVAFAVEQLLKYATSSAA